MSKFCVCWNINGVTGHGKPISAHLAAAWVSECNAEYGAGTHWVGYFEISPMQKEFFDRTADKDTLLFSPPCRAYAPGEFVIVSGRSRHKSIFKVMRTTPLVVELALENR